MIQNTLLPLVSNKEAVLVKRSGVGISCVGMCARNQRAHGIAAARGLIVMDSLAYIRGPSGHRIAAGPRDLSRQLMVQYGIDAEVVGVSGLRFESKHPEGRYVDVLEHVLQHRYQWIMLISGGNDVYGQSDSESLYDAVSTCVRLALTATDAVVVVYGGSAKTWRYRGRFAQEYDARVRRVVDRASADFHKMSGVRILSGALELRSLTDADLVDRIGHLQFKDGFEKLLAALSAWATLARALVSLRSRL